MERPSFCPSRANEKDRQVHSPLTPPPPKDQRAIRPAHADDGEVSKSTETGGTDASSGADENSPNLKISSGRTGPCSGPSRFGAEGRSARRLLRPLVLKEIGDNALDSGTKIRFGQIDDCPTNSSSRTTVTDSTARRKRLPTYSRSGARCGRASSFDCRNADNSATAYA